MPEPPSVIPQQDFVYKFVAGESHAMFELRDLWHHRELIGFLAWRDLASRYRVASLGVIWCLLQPITTAVALTIFLGHIARIPSEGLPYALIAASGVIAWQYYSAVASAAAVIPSAYADLLTKVYFPRLILPIAIVLPPLVDWLIASIPLIAVMALFGIFPTTRILSIPAVLLLAIVSAFGLACWVASVCVRYYDARHVIPFAMQLWLLASPVYYADSLVPPTWRAVYFLNPVAGVISGFRWALFGEGTSFGPEMISSLVGALLLAGSGALLFNWMSARFADIV